MSISRPSLLAITVASLLLVHSTLLATLATIHSPTNNEPGHLAAGLCHVRHSRYNIYNVNPPLTHYIAAMPVMIAGYKEDLSGFYSAPGARPEFAMGSDFINANGRRSLDLFKYSRWAFIPFSLVGGIVCFFWSRELWRSDLSGLISLFFWCFEPFWLGHASLITPDIPAASLGLLVMYLFWHWLKHPTWQLAALTGFCLGLAETCKTSWIILYCLLPAIGTAWYQLSRRSYSRRNTNNQNRISIILQLALTLFLSTYVTCLTYSFDGCFTRLGDFEFVSTALTGNPDLTKSGNRFRNSWLGNLPIPFPNEYIRGIDLQKRDFEQHNLPCYLFGEWKNGGWWYYYACGLCVKTSHGLQAGLALAAVAILCKFTHNQSNRIPYPTKANGESNTETLQQKHHTYQARDLLVIFIPAAAILLLVSSQTEMNRHVRYALPLLGFCFVLIGSTSRWLKQTGHQSKHSQAIERKTPPIITSALRVSTCLALAATPMSMALHFPHTITYFNEISGGPKNGYKHLLHSNADWGQDLLAAGRWIDKHPELSPFLVAGDYLYQPQSLGIKSISSLERPHGDSQLYTVIASVNELQRYGLLSEVKNKSTVPAGHPLHSVRIIEQISPSLFALKQTEKTKPTINQTKEEKP